MASTRFKRIVAPLIPYLTVGVGVLVFRNAWLALLSYHLGMVSVMLISRYKPSLRASFAGSGYLIPVICTALGASAGIALITVWPLLGLNQSAGSYIRSLGLDQRTVPLFFVYFVTVNPWLEETYWRGFLGSDRKRPELNDGLFSGYHLAVIGGVVGPLWLAAAFFCLTAAAWFWRQANRLNGGLLPSMLSHLAADIAVMTVILLALSPA